MGEGADQHHVAHGEPALRNQKFFKDVVKDIFNFKKPSIFNPNDDNTVAILSRENRRKILI
jgi:dTDP-4-dehydrorhamnose 3,5-epimerase-like enzyme